MPASVRETLDDTPVAKGSISPPTKKGMTSGDQYSGEVDGDGKAHGNVTLNFDEGVYYSV